MLLLLLDFNLRFITKFLFPDSLISAHEWRFLWTLRVLELLILLPITLKGIRYILGSSHELIKNLLHAVLTASLAISVAYLAEKGFQSFDSSLVKLFNPSSASQVFDGELFLTAVIVGPWVEEWVFRGWLCQGLLKITNSKLVTFLLSLVPFTLLHLRSDQPLFDQWFMATMWASCAGITTLLYFWRSTIWMGFALHASANFALFFGASFF